MKVTIIGAGQLGYFLAKSLLEENHTVKIIDSDKKRCEKISSSLDVTVFCDDGTRIETLAEAKVGKSDAFIAVTDRDEDNLIACEIAKKQFAVKRTISKSNNHKNIALMKRLGVDIVLDTTQVITGLIEHEIDGSNVKFIADISNSNALISEYRIPESWSKSGKKVMELDVPSECVLIYVIRSGTLMIPRGSTVLMAGDEVTALTVGRSAKALKKLFEL